MTTLTVETEHQREALLRRERVRVSYAGAKHARQEAQKEQAQENEKSPTAAVGTIFARTEKKYLIDRAQLQELLPKLSVHMHSDEYGKTHITSLYLDTPTFYLMRQSIEKPLYKEKYRIRWYGEANPDAQVYFEVKKKFKGTVYKRRVPMAFDEAIAYTKNGQKPAPLEGATPEQLWEADQILREFDYAFSHYDDLVPAFFVTYDRAALIGADDPDLRITFDTTVEWSPGRFDLEQIIESESIIGEGEIVMEIKCNKAMPLWLAEVLDDCDINPQSFSKAGTAYKALLQEEAMEVKGAHCA